MSELRIIVADDDPPITESLQFELEELGHKVVAIATNGVEATELVQELKPDLIVMDIKMPVLDGLAASREIMECCPTPIILLTSHSDPELIAEADDAGVQAYLVKPVDLVELRPAIQLALSRFRQLKMLHEIAHTDELTGLENRRSLMADLPIMMSSARRYGYPLSLILFDLNGFKAINDALGHDAGDETLRAVAEALRLQRRQSDRQYRLGGDEFVLLLPHTDLIGAKKAATRYEAAIEALQLPGAMRLGASFGIATYPVDTEDVDELLHLADERMYTSKRQYKSSRENKGNGQHPQQRLSSGQGSITM